MSFKIVPTDSPSEDMYKMLSDEWDSDEIANWLFAMQDAVIIHMKAVAQDMDNMTPEDTALLSISEPFLFLLGMMKHHGLLEEPISKELH